MTVLSKQFVTVMDRLFHKEIRFPSTNSVFLILTPRDSFNRISQLLNVIVQNEVNVIQDYPPFSPNQKTCWRQWERSYNQCTKDSELMPGRKHRLFYPNALSDPAISD